MVAKAGKLPKGMRCPNCRSRLRCVRNRPRGHGVEDRKRKCGECGFMQWTTEQFKTKPG